MKPSSIPKRILLAFLCLLLSNEIYAQVQPGMTSSERNYKSFFQPRVDKDEEVLARNREFANHPEIGMSFFESPKEACFEDISKRTETTKTYIKKDTRGSGLFVQSSTAPMHYKSGDDWLTVQSNLQPVAQGIFAAERQPDPVSVNTNEKGVVKIGKAGKSLSFNRELELVFIPVNGTEQIVGNADWTNYTAGDDGVYITNAWPGIDIEIFVFRGAAKTNFIVNHALPQYANGKLLVRDHLQLEDGMSLVSSTEKGFVGNIEVFKDNEKIFDIYKAVAYEKNKVEESLIPLAYNISKTILDIEVPGDLFNKPASAYPVVIDPFVQATNSVPVIGSTYSPALTTGCSTLNSVPIPSGMNINGMTWSFTFSSTGTAVLNNARNDFVMGTCKSPPLPGWYWGCAVNFGGTCNGVNLNIYPEMQACIPAPQCSYNQDVYLRWYRTINPGVCDNVGFTATTPFTITFSGNTLDPGPVTASTGTVTPVCAGTSVTLNASGNYGAAPLSYTWYPGPIAGQSVVVNPTATTTYTVQITDACGNIATGTVTVNVLPLPAPPTVTTPVNLCQNGPVPNMSTYVTGTNIQWYTQQVGGAPLAGAPTINMTVPNSYTYWVSQTVNGCESQRAQIVVNVTATPPPPTVTTPVNLCQNSSPPPITSYVTSGVNLLWYTTPVGGVPLGAPPTISTTSVGNIAYYVSQTVNGCESQRSSILIIVTAQPPMPNATSPITYCQFATATPLVATGISLKWYDVPTGGVPLPGAPTPNTSIAGTVTYYVSQTINGCESQRRAVVVNITAKPNPPVVVTPVTYCQGETAQPLSNSVTGTNIKWYLAQTGGAPITMPVVNTSVISNNTYWVSQTVNGCESDRVSINVIVATQPVAPIVVSPVIMCQFSVPDPLSPNVTGTGLKWYLTQTGGVGTVTEPVINTASTGSTTYWVSQSVGSCEGPRAPIVVTINPKPAVPNATSPITYCQFATATALTATGQNLSWYTVPTGGTGSSTAPVPSTAATGTQDYYVSQTVNGCESDRAHVVVNINPTPAAPVTVTPITYCQHETAVPITNHVTPTTGLKWYTTQTGGVGTTTPPTINTAIVSNTTYWVSQTVGGCESDRSPVQIVIGTSPLPPTIVTPLVYCQNDVIPPLSNSVTGFNLTWYTTPTGGTGSTTTPTVDPTIPGTTFFYITQGLGNCESLRDTLEVIVHPTPALPIVVSPTEVCQLTTHTLTAQGQNLLWYTTATGGTGLSSMNANTSTPGSTTYYVSQTINNCEGPREALIITVKPKPAPPTAQLNYTYCQFDTGVTALTATGSNLQWYAPNLLPGAPTPSTQVAGTFHFFVTQTIDACESDKTDIAVLVHPKPGLPVVEQITVCEGDASPVLNAVGQHLLWYDAATGGTGNPNAPVPPTSTVGIQEYYVSQTINGCEGDRALIRVTVNPKVEASLTVNPDRGCTNEPVTITFTGNGPGTSTYTWDFDGADDVTGTGAGPYQVAWSTEGDKTVTVTITNLNCSATASANVNIQSTPKAHFDIQQDVCVDEIIKVQVDYNLMSYPEFVWNFGDAQVLDGSGYGPYSLKWNSTGLKYVSLQLTGINCPSEVFFDTINLHKPVAKLMNISSNEICVADSVLFTAQAGLDYKYEWLPAVYFGENTNTLSIWGRVQKAGYVTLNVTDRWGCVSSDSVMLQPKSCCEVFLPNTFTPNGDGKNDVFRMVSQGNQELSSFVIMDRWGKRVFETINQYEAWDGSYNGEVQDMGTYHYYLRYRCAGTKEIMEMKGDVILLR